MSRKIAAVPNNIIINIAILSAFATWPFVAFVGGNINSGVAIHELFFIYIGFLLVVNLLYVTISRLSKNPRKILTVFIVLSICTFLFDAIARHFDTLSYVSHLFVWLLFCVGISLALWQIPHRKYKPYFVILITLYALSSAGFIQSQYNYVQQQINFHSLSLPAISSKKPNVYFIVVDMYARSDVLKRVHDYDNALFISMLEKKGFFVAKNSYATYQSTYLSISSTLSMSHLLDEGEKTLISERSFKPILQGDNAVARYFKGEGYRYLHSPAYYLSWDRCTAELIDQCLRQQDDDIVRELLSSETIYNLVRLTPLFPPLYYAASSKKHATRLHELKQLNIHVESILSVTRKPFFLYAHILSPHPPFTYGKNCSMETNDYNIKNATIETYVRQVKCVERDLGTLVNTILRFDKNNPIIIIQSDHGTVFRNQSEKHMAQWSHEDIVERYGVLNAILMPRHCRKIMRPTITLVNTFRVVISCLSSKRLPLLPDTSFYTASHRHPQFGLVKSIMKNGVPIDDLTEQP